MTASTLVFLAGPNGTSKTTFINRFLLQQAEAFRFVHGRGLLLPLGEGLSA